MIQSTLELLRAMKMNAMAGELECQMSDPSYQELSTEERIDFLVNAEWNKRQSNKITRLKNAANFSLTSATMEGIEYFPDRKLDKTLLLLNILPGGNRQFGGLETVSPVGWKPLLREK